MNDLNNHQNDLCSLSIKKYPILTTLGFPLQNQFFFRFFRNDFELKNKRENTGLVKNCGYIQLEKSVEKIEKLESFELEITDRSSKVFDAVLNYQKCTNFGSNFTTWFFPTQNFSIWKMSFSSFFYVAFPTRCIPIIDFELFWYHRLCKIAIIYFIRYPKGFRWGIKLLLSFNY